MSAQWKKLQKRFANKWQIPTFIISMGLLAIALFRIRPEITDIPFEDSLEHMDKQLDAGAYELVFQLGQELLAVEEGYTEKDFARVRLRLARARHDHAVRERKRTLDVGNEINLDFMNAEANLIALTAEDHARWGRALGWLGERRASLDHLEIALDGDANHKSLLRKRIFQLREILGSGPEELLALLDDFLAELEPHRLDLRIWGIEQKIENLAETGQAELAATTLVREEETFAGSDFEKELAFLRALLLYRQGMIDEAEVAARSLRNAATSNESVYAKAGWLLGYTVLKDDGPKRPYESITFFRDVLNTHADHPHGVASRLGLAEAFAMLGRHTEAIDSFTAAIDDLRYVSNRRLINRDVVRVSLGLRAQEQRDAGVLRAALAYATLAFDLVDTENDEQLIASLQQLNDIQELLADALTARIDSATVAEEEDLLKLEASELYLNAARGSQEIGKIATLDEKVAAEAHWKAAELYAKAEERQESARLYSEFTVQRPGHPLVPRALLRVGQLRQADGDLEAAIEGYQTCFRRFPKTVDGLRALIPLAQCYMALGTDQYDMVESTLDVILEESEVFTPEAPEFADALFLYGEVSSRRGDFEEAITRIEESIERYPNDVREWAARSLLADCYRQGALALKRDLQTATSAAEIEHMRDQSITRFGRAQGLYRELIDELSLRTPVELSEIEHVNLRHAYVYEADCLFEMANHSEALMLYEEAASLQKDNTTALAAYVQIINCHVFLGQPEDARSALARARILVETMPDAAFAKSISPEGREDWKRYFTWLEDAELF